MRPRWLGAFAVGVLWIASTMLLAMWPLSGRYTSLGVDLESPAGGSRVRCTFYRLRWPGDASVCVGRLVTHRAADARPLKRFDLGGQFVTPAKEVRPGGFWNRRGFWWVTRPGNPEAAAAAMGPGASEVFVAGVPHGLAVVLVGGAALASTRCRRKRHARERCGLQSPPATGTLGAG